MCVPGKALMRRQKYTLHSSLGKPKDEVVTSLQVARNVCFQGKFTNMKFAFSKWKIQWHRVIPSVVQSLLHLSTLSAPKRTPLRCLPTLLSSQPLKPPSSSRLYGCVYSAHSPKRQSAIHDLRVSAGPIHSAFRSRYQDFPPPHG